MSLLTYGLLGLAGIVVLAILFILIIAVKYRTVVPTNMVHIVNSSSGRCVYGKDSKEGNTYYSFPDWIPKIGVNVTHFPTSNFGVELKDYAAYDHKRLPFQVDVQAFFVMEDADVVSQRVSDFRELKEHLTKIVSGAVRKVTSSMPLERILSARSELSEQFDAEVTEQLKDWGVKAVNSIEFMNIQDAPGSGVIEDIQEKEQSRINRESREVQAENEQAAKIKEIEAQRKVAMEQENAAQQVGTRQAEKQQAVGIAQEQAKQAVAEQTKITTERNMEVRLIEETKSAEIKKSVDLTNADAARQTDVIRAEAEKQQLQLKAEADLITAEREAEGIKARNLAEAEGIKSIGEAKADAESKMQLAPVDAQIKLAKEIGENQGYQDYLTNLKQLEVNAEVGVAQAKALENADVKIVGGQGSNTGLQLSSILTAFASTDAGSSLLKRITSPSKDQ